MAPIGSLFYTALWMAWFALATLLYFPGGGQFQEQLTMRLFFFAAFGLISLGVATELQKRRTKLEVQNRQTMGMLAKLVEARDTDAGAHLHRIQHFSKALALHIGLSQRDAQEIAYASLMHDVGKANVPDAILKKPGPLSPDDWITMQHHTLWGEELLAENHDFDLARQVARWHHERWDGRGYPDGLRGPSIPLPARIVSVADVFDALISERPYKRPWTPDAAIEELQRIAGSQLDPDVVAAFVDLYNRGVIDRISQELHEAEQPGMLEQAA
jgi:putative two-component system response regulator